jgi:hypothetical protein
MVTFQKASSLLQMPFSILGPAYTLPPLSFLRFISQLLHQIGQEKRTFITTEASLTHVAQGHLTDLLKEGGVDKTVDCMIEFASPRATATAIANIGMRLDCHNGPPPSSIFPARRCHSHPHPIIIRYRVQMQRCYVCLVWLAVPEQNMAIMPSLDTQRSSFPHMASNVSEADRIFHNAQIPRCHLPLLPCLWVTKKPAS